MLPWFLAIAVRGSCALEVSLLQGSPALAMFLAPGCRPCRPLILVRGVFSTPAIALMSALVFGGIALVLEFSAAPILALLIPMTIEFDFCIVWPRSSGGFSTFLLGAILENSYSLW